VVAPSPNYLASAAAVPAVDCILPAVADLDNPPGQPRELVVAGIHAGEVHLVVAVLRGWAVGQEGGHVAVAVAVAVVAAAAAAVVVAAVGVADGLGMQPQV